MPLCTIHIIRVSLEAVVIWTVAVIFFLDFFDVGKFLKEETILSCKILLFVLAHWINAWLIFSAGIPFLVVLAHLLLGGEVDKGQHLETALHLQTFSLLVWFGHLHYNLFFVWRTIQFSQVVTQSPHVYIIPKFALDSMELGLRLNCTCKVNVCTFFLGWTRTNIHCKKDAPIPEL